jgi:hypothetical protein
VEERLTQSVSYEIMHGETKAASGARVRPRSAHRCEAEANIKCQGRSH